MKKCNCKKCCFDLTPEITGGLYNCFDTCYDIPNMPSEAVAVTYCFIQKMRWTYFRTDKLKNFKCSYYVNRKKLDRGYSNAKLNQYKLLYYDQLYYDRPGYREKLDNMISYTNQVIQFGISKLSIKLKASLKGYL